MQNNDTTDSIVHVTHAAYAHVETVVAQADGNSGASPWWQGEPSVKHLKLERRGSDRMGLQRLP